jgi:hypothetical protein
MKMATFQEFLEKLARQQHHQERHARREEWIAAVGRLLDRLRQWLTESDPNRVLEILPMEILAVEPGLGSYTVPSLKIGLGDVSVRVVPVGRDAVGVIERDGGIREGRVDITDGVRRYILYRTLQDQQESWYVLDERFQAAPLDRSRLEEILQDLLS